jgi:hypothetical protein
MCQPARRHPAHFRVGPRAACTPSSFVPPVRLRHRQPNEPTTQWLISMLASFRSGVSMQRFSVIVIAAVLLAACDQTTSPVAPTDGPNLLRTTQHSITREPFAFSAFADCFGELKATTNVVVSGKTGTFQHVAYAVTALGTAVGQVTGNTYSYHEVDHSAFNSPNLAAPHFVITDHVGIHLISHGSQPDATLRLVFHLVVTGQRVEKILVNTAKPRCPVQGA